MKKIIIILVVIVAVVALVLLRKSKANDGQAVVLEALQTHNIRASILASGKLTHEDDVKLSTEVIGKVAALYVKEGDRVAQGQVVAQINDEALRALVDQQRASSRVQEIAIESQKLRLANLDTAWKRKMMLHDRRLLDDNSFEASTNELELARLDVKTRQASLDQAHAILAEAEKNLKKTQVVAPLAGVVTSLDIKVGEMAISSTTNVPGSSLMTIANPASIQTQVNVDEADIANIKVGEEAQIVAIGYPDQPMKGHVKEIAITAKPPTTTATSLSFFVKIQIDDTNGVALHPGMSSRAEIFTSTNESVPGVPIQALLVDEDKSAHTKTNYVFKYDNGVARKIKVEIGIADDSYQQIKTGLANGDRIISGPNRILRNLEDGDKVKEDTGTTKEKSDKK